MLPDWRVCCACAAGTAGECGYLIVAENVCW
jgi:hypothetical protein